VVSRLKRVKVRSVRHFEIPMENLVTIEIKENEDIHEITRPQL
jgi:hypothetical protein